VDAVRDGGVKLDEIDDDQLPEEMQKMSAEERSAYLAKQQAERDKLNASIKDLSAKRASYITKKLSETKGEPEGFDAKVIETLRSQAARKGITYK